MCNSSNQEVIIEACVGTLAQSLKAEKQGADRIELCDRLDLGGTTPSEELIRTAKKELSIPIRVIIRPRGGDFVYSTSELEEMRKSILFCKSVGVDGVVLGILNNDNKLDIEAMKPLIELAKPMNVIIHKAIDRTENPYEEMKQLQKIDGVNGILTSGGPGTAEEGAEVLRKMVKDQDNLVIVVAGGVTSENRAEIHNLIGAEEYHGKLIVGKLA